uniref:Uncharacterized protein n=1 Tax=Arundo donax TaxID=35708 RepID=A0A0A9C4V5_ARUDO
MSLHYVLIHSLNWPLATQNVHAELLCYWKKGKVAFKRKDAYPIQSSESKFIISCLWSCKRVLQVSNDKTTISTVNNHMSRSGSATIDVFSCVEQLFLI